MYSVHEISDLCFIIGILDDDIMYFGSVG